MEQEILFFLVKLLGIESQIYRTFATEQEKDQHKRREHGDNKLYDDYIGDG